MQLGERDIMLIRRKCKKYEEFLYATVTEVKQGKIRLNEKKRKKLYRIRLV